MSNKITGLELMRVPFPDNMINKLPKGTKAQNDCPASEKINCKVCGGWHHPKIIHLDYVGHAALTDRLLDVDPLWTWEPLAFKDGLPAFDDSGGLWIKLTVCGHTRLGYGHAPASNFKEIGSREKEVIGDALRNAAMRFGAALDLWFKGDLHNDEPEVKPEVNQQATKQPPQAEVTPKVNQSLYDELSIHCKGDLEQMETLLKRLTHYEVDGKEYSFGLDRLPKASEKWTGKTLVKLRKLIADCAEPTPIICNDCGGVDGLHSEGCPEYPFK